MLPRRYRLPLRKEFRRIKENGKFVPGRFFSLIFCQGPSSISRFAFIVSVKVHPKACWRNRAKRRLSEAVKLFLKDLHPGFEAIFLAKKMLLGASFSQIKTEVFRTFKKAKIINDHQ